MYRVMIEEWDDDGWEMIYQQTVRGDDSIVNAVAETVLDYNTLKKKRMMLAEAEGRNEVQS